MRCFSPALRWQRSIRSRADHPLAKLWRQRLALSSAEMVMRLQGRGEDACALRDHLYLTRTADLTRSEVLVLMCIAYFQPITRGELSSFFGKEISRDLIGHLRSSGMIASGPRSPTPGAPYTCVTTKAFLLEFGLDTLRDLPDFEALEDAGLLSKDKLLAGDIPAELAAGDEIEKGPQKE